MSRQKKITQREVAQRVITTKETAEVFIRRWMDWHNVSREMALIKLEELGIKISELPDTLNH